MVNETEFKTELAKLMKQARVDRNWLSYKLDVSKTSIANWLKGMFTPSKTMQSKTRRILHNEIKSAEKEPVKVSRRKPRPVTVCPNKMGDAAPDGRFQESRTVRESQDKEMRTRMRCSRDIEYKNMLKEFGLTEKDMAL